MNDAKTIQAGQVGETLPPEAARLFWELADILNASDICSRNSSVEVSPYCYGMIGDREKCEENNRRTARELAGIFWEIQRLESERRRAQ